MSEHDPQKHGFATRAIHAGQPPDPSTGAINTPIFLSSTYVQEEIGKHKGYEYSRVSNPTRTALEDNLAALEGGRSGHVFASGMAAVTALVTMMKSGDHVICGHNVYGGTPRMFNQVYANYGLEFTYVDTTDPENVRRAFKPNTRLVHVETPTNPLMQLTDIRAVADIAHEKGVDLCVDNTFMSPYFQQPIELGADIVMHSTTKFLNGHSDGLGGALIATRPDQSETFAFVQKCTGGIMSPFEAYLVLRGVKTLAVRMEQHDKNGRIVAEFLEKSPAIERVLYPGLESNPQYELAKRQMTGFGALITFEAGSLERANHILKRVRVISLGESLGGVESLISHPATMTHAALGEEGRRKIGLSDGMIRLSVGIEDVDDLVGDLEQAIRGL